MLDLLGDLGDVVPAKDLEAGLAAARELRPAVILVAGDPGADPLDALIAVRRDPALRAVPVVMLAIDPEPEEAGDPGRPGRGRDVHQVAQALQRLMLDEVMKVSYILASAAGTGNDAADRQVMAAIARLDDIAIALRDAVIDLRRGNA
ncbi:hypothetical protein GCM10009844_06210 [Nocardioides koreensis]|uniref:Uncharacterized protein n=1 Tax=Nocardioides koreensis TaxID=433651 RepID=A0ABN2Z860_9ACTN